MQFAGEWLKAGGKQEDTLGLEGAANTGECGWELFFEESESLRGGGAVLQGAFENVDEHETEFLEFDEDGFRGVPFRSDLHGAKNPGGLALEEGVGGIEKIGVEGRGDSGEEERVDVERAKAGGPGKALEAAGDVGGVGELAAAVTGEESGIRHDQGKA
jgi:hypothetical protein